MIIWEEIMIDPNEWFFVTGNSNVFLRSVKMMYSMWSSISTRSTLHFILIIIVNASIDWKGCDERGGGNEQHVHISRLWESLKWPWGNGITIHNESKDRYKNFLCSHNCKRLICIRTYKFFAIFLIINTLIMSVSSQCVNFSLSHHVYVCIHWNNEVNETKKFISSNHICIIHKEKLIQFLAFNYKFWVSISTHVLLQYFLLLGHGKSNRWPKLVG